MPPWGNQFMNDAFQLTDFEIDWI